MDSKIVDKYVIELDPTCNYGFSPMPPHCHIVHTDCTAPPQLCVVDNPPVHGVPEPATYVLLGIGFIVLFILRRLKND